MSFVLAATDSLAGAAVPATASDRWEEDGIPAIRQEEAHMVAVGQIAPRFSLFDQREREVELPTSEAPTVLVFYRGDW